jgi:hypothetical protein
MGPQKRARRMTPSLFHPSFVMAALVAAIHTHRDAWVFMDRPDKPGDDAL